MTDQKAFGCKNCGANLVFEPGTTTLACPYCGAQNEIVQAQEVIEELDYKAFFSGALQQQEMQQVTAVKCSGCGAETDLPPNVTADECPYCGISLIAGNSHSLQVIKPKSVLPFQFTQQQSQEALSKWIGSLWFAPSNLKRFADKDRGLKGLYIPSWTYDSNTVSSYRGARGEHYNETEHYTTTEGGKQVTRTRQVRKTRWYSTSGTVTVRFDDVLVMASNSLPRNYAERLEPWDLKSLVPYQEAYLPGFRTESYQIDLAAGFERAKEIMDDGIRSAIRSDIGGDEQRIDAVNTNYNDITFKHILLPVWIGAYRYQGKVYQFIVNARTGEVQGSRPYSWIKITLFVLMILIVLIVLVYFVGG